MDYNDLFKEGHPDDAEKYQRKRAEGFQEEISDQINPVYAARDISSNPHKRIRFLLEERKLMGTDSKYKERAMHNVRNHGQIGLLLELEGLAIDQLQA